MQARCGNSYRQCEITLSTTPSAGALINRLLDRNESYLTMLKVADPRAALTGGLRFPIPLAGICSSGIGFALNSLRQGIANQRAHPLARLLRALSVAIPVVAYICRYSFEINRNASRDL